MIDERLYADLVDLYNENVKTFKEQNTGLIIDNILPLNIEDIDQILNVNEYIDYAYIRRTYRSFTVNPQITNMEIRNGVTYVEISPDISWERQVNT